MDTDFLNAILYGLAAAIAVEAIMVCVIVYVIVDKAMDTIKDEPPPTLDVWQ